MDFTAKESKMIQGLSILAMIWLHLFDRPYEGLFSPWFFFADTPISFYVAQLADFCVFGYAFCSGYAHMRQLDRPDYYRKRMKGLLSLLCSFWLILLVFSVLSTVVGQGSFMPCSAKEFLLNAFLLHNSFNGAWWYLYAYFIIVLISPLMLKWTKRCNSWIVMGSGFILYCAAYYVRFHVQSDNFFVLKFGPLGMTIFEYLIGAIFAKENLFDWLYQFWSKIRKPLRMLISWTLIIGMLYGRTKIVPSLIAAPFSGIVIISLYLFWKKPEFIKNVLLFLGEHSTNIWLTHMFFYSVLFKNLVYSADYPILILIFMLAITLPLSYILKWIQRPLQRRIAGI